MFAQRSISALLKAVVTVLSLLVIVQVAFGAWQSWKRCVLADQVSDVTEASGYTFAAMNNLRLDRSRSSVALTADAALAGEAAKALDQFRADENKALKSALATLREITLADHDSVLASLTQRVDSLTKRETETREAMNKPKAERRAELAKEYVAGVDDLLAFLEDLNRRLMASVKHGDAFVDQMLTLKQMAWNLRNTGGSAAGLVTAAISSGKFDAAAQRQYAEYVGGITPAWNGVEEAAAGGRTPASVTQAIETARAAYLGKGYTETRERIIAALAKGEKPEMDALAWGAFNLKAQDTLGAIAIAALDAASTRAADQTASANRQLAIWSGILVLTLLLAIGSLVVIGRRVIVPIGRLENAMRRLAGGDLTVETPYRGRTDEIGGFADAFEVFRVNAIDKSRIETEQAQARQAREQRSTAIENAIRDFEAEVLRVLELLANSSGTMKDTARRMSDIATGSTQKAGDVAVASQQASANVQAVAAATEELAYSIREIGQQVSTSQSIARQAVHEAEATNTTVNSLVDAAARVDDIVSLIQSIASQTNLLALNATIEAARAGEAGKGFAVVANEVKHLATQTAQATEQISHQIQSIQTITTEAAKAIHGIGGTIVRIDEISTMIAAAVEEQNAATSDIARNVDQAARGASRVSDSIADVTEAANETGGAADHVLNASANSDALTSEIRSHVADFLQRIRMA